MTWSFNTSKKKTIGSHSLVQTAPVLYKCIDLVEIFVKFLYYGKAHANLIRTMWDLVSA